MSRPRLLIVDDDAALLQALPEALHLRMDGVTVETADSATAALDRIADHDYDAIVTDIKMPGMDGLALLAEIRARRPDTPTLMTYIVTPAFPTYTSGHSTQSAAAARALTHMFGIRGFTDTTHQDHNLTPEQHPRAFNSFNEAAAEAAVSRLYGGIHFTFDNDDGFVSGNCIADKIRDRVRFKRGRGHDDDNFDDDDKRDDVDPDDDNDGSPDDQDLDDDNDLAADAADADDDNDGIDDEFDSESTREDQNDINGDVPAGSEDIYNLVADSKTLLLVATAEAAHVDALLQVEIYSPSGTLLATSPPTTGRAVAFTVPTLGGIYKVKIKNLGQGSTSYETLLITRTNWLSGQLQ